MDPGTLPRLTKIELFTIIANGFRLLTIVEETSICAVASLFYSLSKIAGWFQSSIGCMLYKPTDKVLEDKRNIFDGDGFF